VRTVAKTDPDRPEEGALRVVAVARLSDVKLRSKLAPLVAMPEIAERTLVRRTPLGMDGVRDVCPPRWLRRPGPLAEAWRLIALLSRCARRPRPSFLISFYFFPHALYIDLAGRLFGIPTIPVAISHEDVERALESPAWAGLVRRAHAVGVRGERSAARLEALGLPSGRLFAPPNVFDPGPFVPARDAIKEWDVVYVGALEPVKRLDVWLEALALARSRMGRLRGLIIGDGPERARLEAARARLGLGEDLVITGWLADDQIARSVQRSRLFALTSRYEGLPMAMIEALSCAVPVVVPDVGDVTAVAHHGENAWVVGPSTAEAYAEAFVALLDDPGRLARLVEGAERTRERFAEQYSLESAVAAWRPVLSRRRS
jgi:glycosyltransferase involved in cell wall biosynthesis